MAPSTDVLIGNQGGPHVWIRPLSRRQPNLFEASDDDNGIDCEIEVAAGGFRGAFHADLRNEEFRDFLEEVETLDAAPDGAGGTAAFTAMEGQLALVLAGDDGKKCVRVTGEALDDVGSANRLAFTFEIDRTCLPLIARSLRDLLAAFPVAGVEEPTPDDAAPAAS